MNRPPWLRAKSPSGANYSEVKALVDSARLHTVCQSANCPNIGECWRERTATFMILGNTCTRNCRFCAVDHGRPTPADPDEPRRVAEAVAHLKLKHAVVTSVTRDDLPGGGAGIFAETIRLIHEGLPGCTVEVLIPDFQGNWSALQAVVDAAPEVLNHNVETVERMYALIRPQAVYRRSLELLRVAKELGGSTHRRAQDDAALASGEASAQSAVILSPSKGGRLTERELPITPTASSGAQDGVAPMRTKSGIMVGVGETWDEVIQTMKDLREVGCDILTIGQYLAPSSEHAPIERYYTPDEFAELQRIGTRLGFGYVHSGPLVRSSYHAADSVGS